MSRNERLYFLDNIRWSMIVLVLLVHSAVTYGPIGSWFYHEQINTDGLSGVILLLIPLFLQTFFMGLLFFVAGYLVPASLARKGDRRYVADRAVRLGVPALLFMLVLAPLIFLMAYGDTAISYLPTYFADPTKWDSGPLWFALALLLFSLGYLLWTRYGRGPTILRSPPTNLTILVFILTIIFATVGVRLFFPIGASVWNMQLSFFSQYIALFLLGIVAYHGNWLMSFPVSQGRLWGRVAILTGVFVFPLIFIAGGALDGNFDVFAGGLTWQAISLAIVEQFVGIGACIGLLVWFRERHNSQGKVSKVLSDNSFAIYIFHAPVLVAIALLLAATGLPVLVKFAVVFLVGLAVTLAISIVLRKVPLLRKVL